MNEPDVEKSSNSESVESFAFNDLRSLEWWVRQFTKTQNCAPGGVMLIFGGSLPLSPLAAAWFVAAWGMRTIEGEHAFSNIIHVVPPPAGKRDSTSEICRCVKDVVANSGQAPDAQQRAAEACASRCLEAMDAHHILGKLEQLPEGSAVAITHAERVRYADVEVNRETVLTTHTGFQVHFASDEQMALPHLYKLIEDLLRITTDRNISVVVLAQLFGPELSAIPEKILGADHLSVFHGQRGESNTSHLQHYLAAEEMRKHEGIHAARAYVEKNIDDTADRALVTADLLGREQLFSAAWGALVPHVTLIRKGANGRTLLNLAQAAAAAGAASEALPLLEEAWTAGLDELESLNSAALVARQLEASELREKLVAAMRSNYPDHPSTVARQYEWLFESGAFAEAASIARKIGKEFEAAWCELNGSPNPQWDAFLELGVAAGRSDDALLRVSSMALQRGDPNLARNFMSRVSLTPNTEVSRIRLLIALLNKELATADEDDLERIDKALNDVFHYVAIHPDDSKARLDLAELFETSLPDMTAMILMGKRCSDTFSRWQQTALSDAIEFQDEPLSTIETVDSFEDASVFMETVYREGKASVIGRGNVPATFTGRLHTDLLVQLGRLMSFAGRQSNTQLMIEVLHGICIVCRGLENPNSDYVAGLHAMGVLIHAGKGQEALNLSETMLLFWPAGQNKFEAARRAHGWAAMSDAHLRVQNPTAALLHLCLCFEAMAQADVKQNIVLLRHKLRLAARTFRTLRLTQLGRGFLEMERQFVALFPADKREVRELAVLELSYDLADITPETPISVLERMVTQCGELLRDDSETEWSPIVSCSASTLAECRRRGVPVPDEMNRLLLARLGRCPTRIQNLIRRHLLENPQLTDIEAALRDLEDAARFDDQGFQLTVLEGFLRRAITTACARNDSDLFLAAATLLSQPAIAAVHARGLRSVSLKLQTPGSPSDSDGFDSPERLADYAAATHLESAAREIRFSQTSLAPLAAVRYMAAVEETLCVLAYDSQRRLCQLLIRRDEVDGPKQLPETLWSAAKHVRWSRCFPDHYAWEVKSNYGVIDERPKPEAIKASLKNLSIDVPPGANPLTIVPEAELFGFPFVITASPSVWLGERTRCAVAPSLPWLMAVRQANTRSAGRIDAWLGSPTKSPFDVLKVRDGIMPIIQTCGGHVHNTDTPEPLRSADLAIVLSHGGRGIARSFAGIPEEFGRFTTDDLADWLGQCPCVVLFVCHAGRSDDRLYNQETFGLVSRLLRRQVRLVIAPPWPLNTDIPSIWLSPFLSALRTGSNGGVAADKAAQVVRARFTHPCAWGAMQLFGDAEYRFTNE